MRASTASTSLRSRGDRGAGAAAGAAGDGSAERRSPLYFAEDREYFYGDDRPLSYLSRPRARPDGEWYYAAEPSRFHTAGSETYYDRAPRDVSPEPRAASSRRSSSLASLLNRETAAPATTNGLTSATISTNATASSSSSSERPPKARGRSAPYLTESNRRDIMERIRRGEKQADLAKEYNVSRAAITNLKQRRQMLEMLENSSNAKHREEAQKRRRLSHGTTEPETAEGSTTDGHEPPGGQPPSLRSEDNDSDESDAVTPADHAATSAETTRRPPSHREISAQTTSRLLATLLDPEATDAAFRAAVARHSRLLLEETIGWSFSQAPDRYDPFALAIGDDEAPRLLHEYLQIEPASASASLREVEQRAVEDEVEIVARVPAVALRHSPVFVFIDDLVHEGGAPSASTTRQLLFLLHSLVFSGLDERRIVVAVLLCDESAALDVARRFPDVHVVTTRFLSENAPAHERSRLNAYRSRRRRASSERHGGE